MSDWIITRDEAIKTAKKLQTLTPEQKNIVIKALMDADENGMVPLEAVNIVKEARKKLNGGMNDLQYKATDDYHPHSD